MQGDALRSARTAAPAANSAARGPYNTKPAGAPRRRPKTAFVYANSPRRLIPHYDARDADKEEPKGRGAAALVEDLE